MHALVVGSYTAAIKATVVSCCKVYFNLEISGYGCKEIDNFKIDVKTRHVVYMWYQVQDRDIFAPEYNYVGLGPTVPVSFYTAHS